jgi:exodeoxyribonuclease VII small subunit
MENISYNQAAAELDKILAELRSDACDIDTLTARTRRAVELLQFCRARLTTTHDELQSILASLQTPENTAQ